MEGDLSVVHVLGKKMIALPLGTTRWLAFLSVMPLFSMLAARGIMEMAAAFALGFPLLASMAGQAPDLLDIGVGGLSLLLAKEAMVGAALGLLFGAPIWAMQVAGDIFDNVKGEAQGNVIDPRNSDEMLMSGRFLSLLYVTFLMTSGGFLVLMGTVYDSFELWPVTTLLPDLSGVTLASFLGFIQQMLILALIIGGPLIFLIFGIDLMVAFVARSAPNMEALTLGMALKTFVGAMALVVYMAVIPDIFAITNGVYEDMIKSLRGMFHGR